MQKQEINERLKAIYQDYLSGLLVQKDSLSEINQNISSPLFMKVFDEYEMAKYKILIVGQETNSWCDNLGTHTHDDLLNEYETFELGQKVIFGKKKFPRILNSPFWNFSRRFFVNTNFSENERTKENRLKKGFLWTNISKIDDDGDSTNEAINNLNSEGFKLLRREVEIVKPDVVLFMTGGKYNQEIETHLNLKFEEIFTTEDKKTSVERAIHINEVAFPKHTYRINHPRFLYSYRNHNTILDKLDKFLKP